MIETIDFLTKNTTESGFNSSEIADSVHELNSDHLFTHENLQDDDHEYEEDDDEYENEEGEHYTLEDIENNMELFHEKKVDIITDEIMSHLIDEMMMDGFMLRELIKLQGESPKGIKTNINSVKGYLATLTDFIIRKKPNSKKKKNT